MIARALFVAASALMVLVGGIASAHQQKASLTEVSFNPRSATIEVVHRFVLHDAEHAVRVELGIEGDLFSDEKTREAFAAYVTERFSLKAETGAPLELTLVGTEIDDGYLWVYQEAPGEVVFDEQSIGALIVRAGALRDVWPAQVNRVNIKRGSTVQSLIFSGPTEERRAVFEN